jgi:hypothetical protein
MGEPQESPERTREWMSRVGAIVGQVAASHTSGMVAKTPTWSFPSFSRYFYIAHEGMRGSLRYPA